MRICFVAHADSVHTQHWVRHFDEAGHEVSLVSITPGAGPEGVKTFQFRPLWRPSHERTNWQHLAHLPALWRVLRRLAPDVVNAHFLTSNGLLAALTKPARIPLVISVHGSDVLRVARRSPLHARAARFALRRAALVTSAGSSLTEELRRLSGAEKPVLTLQYGVDTRVFHPSASESERSPVVVSARALVRLSNVDAVIDAMSLLRREDASLELDVCNDGAQRADLERLAAARGVAERTRFRGTIRQSDLAERLRAAALYVSMSASDGASLALLEAMACGAFPVVADTPANREWIADGVNGFLVPPGSPQALAGRLVQAWRDPRLRAAAAAHSWDLVREKADRRRNMGIIEASFERIAATSPG